MIPFSPGIFIVFAIIGLIVLAAPIFMLYLLIFALRVYGIARKEQVPFVRLLFKSRFFIIVLILTTIIAGIASFALYEFYSFERQFNEEMHYKESRRNFILPEDHLYGEIIFPKGTLVKRYDGSDNGEPERPLSLGGLDAARFPYPVEIAGVMTSALETFPGRLELSEDQYIGPVFYYSPHAGDYGALVQDRTIESVRCLKGDVALFDIPSRDDDAPDYNEEGVFRNYQDGKEAYFKPSEWKFQYCEKGRSLIVPPAYGSAEALQKEEEERLARLESDQKHQTIVKDGVLMDAEPIEFTISIYLEAFRQYHFTAQKSGLEADYSESFKLFQQAAEDGETEAYFYIGEMYYKGEGVTQDYEKAMIWFTKAVEAGDNNAISRLGRIYLQGKGIPQDYEKASELFLQAVDLGNSDGAFYLGMMHAEGLYYPQDYQEALQWFKEAANAGNVTAVMNIGHLYYKGLLGKKDSEAAEPWYEKACYLGAEKACEALAKIKAEAQIEAGIEVSAGAEAQTEEAQMVNP